METSTKPAKDNDYTAKLLLKMAYWKPNQEEAEFPYSISEREAVIYLKKYGNNEYAVKTRRRLQRIVHDGFEKLSRLGYCERVSLYGDTWYNFDAWIMSAIGLPDPAKPIPKFQFQTEEECVKKSVIYGVLEYTYGKYGKSIADAIMMGKNLYDGKEECFVKYGKEMLDL